MFSELEGLIQKMEKVPRWFVHFHSVSLWLNLRLACRFVRLSLSTIPSPFQYLHITSGIQFLIIAN